MNVSDKQIIQSMRKELDDLLVEEQLDMEVQERIIANQRPATPYEKTAEYLAEQEAIEAELAVARQARRTRMAEEASQSAVALQSMREHNIALNPKSGELKMLREELKSLDRKRKLTSASPLTESGLPSSSVKAATSHDENDEALHELKDAIAKGRECRDKHAALRREMERNSNEVALMASRHARELDVARAAALAAEEYERNFQKMRAKLRKEVLREAFGSDVFRPLSPIRVEQADLFLEFEYESEEFASLSDASKSLDSLVEEYRQLPHVWEFFVNRCCSVFAVEDAVPLIFSMPPQAASFAVTSFALSGEVSPSSHSPMSSVAFMRSPCQVAIVDNAFTICMPPLDENPAAVIEAQASPVAVEPESLIECRQLLEQTKAPLRMLEEEQVCHEETLRCRREASARLVEERERKNLVLPTLSPMEMSGSMAALLETKQGLDIANLENISTPPPPSSLAPTQFANPRPEQVIRALGEEALVGISSHQSETTSPPSTRDDRSRGVSISFTAGDGDSASMTRGREDSVTAGGTGTRSRFLAKSLSRRNLSKILRFHQMLDVEAAAANNNGADVSQLSSSDRCVAAFAEYPIGTPFLRRMDEGDPSHNASSEKSTRRVSRLVILDHVPE